MREKVVLVTGATSGIGFFSALGLASQGANVTITGTEESAGLAAVAEIQRRSGQRNVRFFAVDHASLGENQRLARRIEDELGRLDVLVNNAGGLVPGGARERKRSPDGYEPNLALNFLGPFALTDALIPLLGKSPGSRILNVVSPRPFSGDPFASAPPELSDEDAYARAELLNVLWILHLARELWGSPIVVNAVDPVLRRFALRRSPEREALAIVTAASEPAYGDITGFLFRGNGRPEPAPYFALDTNRQELARSFGLRMVASAARTRPSEERGSVQPRTVVTGRARTVELRESA